MISFGEFHEIIETEKQINECANLIANLDFDPNTVIESTLEEEELVEGWRDWLGGIGRMGQAAGQVASSVSRGIAQASDTISGPAVKFDKAVSMLKELEQYLRKNPATVRVPSSTNPKRSIAGFIQSVYKALEKESASMPKLMNTSKYQLRGRTQPRQAQPQQQAQPQAQQAQPQQQAQQQPPAMRLAQ
jgi:hypothetical protein